jgi:DNA-binding response OmpR family regulator
MDRREALVLLVEDDPVSRAATERLLQHEGFAVESAATLTEAIRKVELLRPRLILLDAALPDGEGIDVLHYLKARRLSAAVAVTTGSVEAAVLGGYEAAGAGAVFIKPVAPAELLKWMAAQVTRELPT